MNITADLSFGAPFAPSSQINFAPVIGPAPRQLTLAAALPALTAAITLKRVVPRHLTLSGTLPGMTAAVALAYDNNVWRGVHQAISAVHRDGKTVQASTASGWRPSGALTGVQVMRWQSADTRTAVTALRIQSTQPLDAADKFRFAQAVPAGSSTGSLYHRLQAIDAALTAWSQPGRAVGSTVGGTWHRMTAIDAMVLARWRAMVARSMGWLASAQQGVFQTREWRIPWQSGRPLTGVSWPIPALSTPPQLSKSAADIHFLCPFLFIGDLEFIRDCSEAAIRIPLRRMYYVLHDIAITRVSDGAALEFADLTLSADTGSWGWALSGNALGAVTYQRLTATPFTEINVRINGVNWRFLMTSVAHHRQFGKSGYPVSGISPALALTAPLSEPRTVAMAAPWTMQQLADKEVENTAWTIAWTAPDWLVPAGVWRYANQTPLQAIGTLAEAAGGFVQAGRANPVIQVRPQYAFWPWEWAVQAVDYEWPTALVTDLKKNPKTGTKENAVYVAGESVGGILGYVKRAGTAGDKQPGQPITNALITHADAARAFGGTWLADQQDQIDVQFNTILGGDAPLVDLGRRLQLTEPGQPALTMLTQAVSIAVSRGSSKVTVTQSVKGLAFP